MASSRSNARLIRFGIFALVLFFCGYILTKGSSYPAGAPGGASTAAKNAQNAVSGGQAAAPAAAAAAGPLAGNGAGAAFLIPPGKVKATFVTLARNSDLQGLTQSITHIEERFNSKYHYDWVFLNDAPFDEDFKTAVQGMVSGQAKFGLIPQEHWSYPEWIDKEKAALGREEMVAKNVIYGGSESYRHMCRFESGFFFRHALLEDYEYYWRVEPDIKIHCDIDYDLFQYMKDNDKWYGWTISLPEYRETIPTLWDTTRKFMEENPQYLAKDNNMAWISNDKGNTYNGCHFWSNFEIGALGFWKSEAYLKYFDALDKAGGFFYERWGDAPVHSIAASLFMPRDKLHFFQDVGYFHTPFNNCPVDQELRAQKKCLCEPEQDFTWRPYSCTPKYFTLNGLKRPKGWENFTS
ncbi:glycosyl transferase [Metschnikowia bicuspidata var. bicuspidata NRRL YB-4993]|uniref:Glycosyl transferase n=1 Tax=Metschnikowia bicuspidata var. bicuspidata NRRL YB-4993 TaxID=869754 RepID=A0A1A0HKG4_9ASCO|nr:glycosyl transferase [Metschnikowia bicuspidata var. bicuspidata NRRL YB-4993]OBA24298.1 glycosyl transferase [Metschnikowia bicuspidata var. bicuspidata NRRL YB-4993]